MNKGSLMGDLALVLLPWPLFLVPFRLASENVILSMASVSTILALTAIKFNRTLLELLTLNVRVLIAGLIIPCILIRPHTSLVYRFRTAG